MKKTLIAAGLLLAAVILGAAETPFQWAARTVGDTIEITAAVAPNHYIYSNDTFTLSVTGGNGSAATLESAPATHEIEDQFMGATKIFPAGDHIWTYKGIPPFSATVQFQGCRKGTLSKPGLCFLPETINLTPGSAPAEKIEQKLDVLPLQEQLENFRTLRKSEGLVGVEAFNQFLNPQSDRSASAAEPFADTGIWLMIVMTLLGGLALNLTPCVLPMIPVNLAIIGADGAGKGTGFRRGLAYGIGMAAAYGILGIAVILTGARFGQLNASSTFNFVIAAIFLVLAAAMFGAFNIDLSGKFRISPKKLRGGKTLIALVMGAFAALLAGACVAPVVISVLLFSTERYNDGNIFALGLPFLLGVGMALPWPLAGAGFGVLPKPGYFMVVIKYVFGIIIALAALYYAWTGWTLLPGKFSPDAEVARLEKALIDSRASGKPVLIDFWATWCKNCRDMEKNVMPDPSVQENLKRYTVVKFQAEDLSSPAVKALLDRWKLPGLPAFVILQAK